MTTSTSLSTGKETSVLMAHDDVSSSSSPVLTALKQAAVTTNTVSMNSERRETGSVPGTHKWCGVFSADLLCAALCCFFL